MTRKSLMRFYFAIALVTLVFQVWVRSTQCVGANDCAPSYAKAVIWSTIWPASWPVYLAGLPAFQGLAS